MSTYKITSGTGNIAIQKDSEETPTRFQKGQIGYEITESTHYLRIFRTDTGLQLYNIALGDVRGSSNQNFSAPSALDSYLDTLGFFLSGTA